MNAWALRQVDLSPVEILAAVVIGLLGLVLILVLFRSRKRPAVQPAQRPSAPETAPQAAPAVPLERAIHAAEAAILALARAKVASAGIFHFGAVDIHPKHLAYWITADTDAERDRLQADAPLQDAFRRTLTDAGYPAEAIPEVGFAFQSQETVDRDYAGNWFHAVK